MHQIVRSGFVRYPFAYPAAFGGKVVAESVRVFRRPHSRDARYLYVAVLVCHYLNLVMNVTPSTVRHLNAFPLRMPYCEQLRLVRLASPRLVAGMVATSPTSSVPIG